MGLFNTKKENELIADNKILKHELIEARLAIVRSDDIKNEYKIKYEESEVQHRLELSRVSRDNFYQVQNLKADITLIEDNFETAVHNATVDAINKLADKEDRLEREFRAKALKQDKEHAERMARLEKKFEDEKVSYQKYLRTQRNSDLEVAQAKVIDLTKENGELRGENKVLISSSKITEGQLSQIANVTEKIICALPSVSAEITTPEVNIQLPKVEAPKGGNGNQDKK
jgi:hypothetical protein